MEQLLKLPSADHPGSVERLARIGAAEEDIAAELHIPLKRLRKRFRRELERGSANGRNEVLQELFDKAKSGSHLTATSLWVKARCGWRDTGTVHHSPAIIHSVLNVNTTGNENNSNRT